MVRDARTASDGIDKKEALTQHESLMDSVLTIPSVDTVEIPQIIVPLIKDARPLMEHAHRLRQSHLELLPFQSVLSEDL